MIRRMPIPLASQGIGISAPGWDKIHGKTAADGVQLVGNGQKA